MATQWHLYCADAHSNEVVSQALNGLQTVSEFKKHECADGKERELYDVPEYSFANRLWRSQKTLHATLDVYRSQDGGKPAKWEFPKKKKSAFDTLKKRSDQIKKSAMATRLGKQKNLL